jgi:ABC-type nitrate/sulfonate/bicarbonate transport system ATPase subunit
MPAKGVRMQVATEQQLGVVVDGVRRVIGGRTVLDGLDLAVPLHGRVGIVGRSGSGKSTLLGLVAGLDDADAGAISVAGGSALMPQKDCLLPWRSALDNACLALENRGVGRRDARRRAADLFARVGLAGTEQLRPSQLSGGMRQRVAFVRTLLADKEALLLDEPFGALDAITRGELQEWLRETLADQPRTVLLVTHDVEEAIVLCDEVAVLGGGRITASFAVDVEPVRTDTAFVELRERVLEAIA